jgi:8-oxo-dGTP pyrophosphatase MutT (NUDIX family)
VSDVPTVSVRVSIVDVVVARLTNDGIQVLLLRRAAGVRCTGAWEIVHGSIEPGERPEDAAVRELREEAGYACERLYNVTLGGFYLHQRGVVALTVVFCAIVSDELTPPTLGEEHDAWEWCPLADAQTTCAWPREREALSHVAHLLRNGRDGGAVEDVLLVSSTAHNV